MFTEAPSRVECEDLPINTKIKFMEKFQEIKENILKERKEKILKNLLALLCREDWNIDHQVLKVCY